MNTKVDISKVSTWSRVLAWILIVCGMLAVFGWAGEIYRKGGWPWNTTDTISGVLILVFYFSFAGYVAVKGRSPRWLTAAEKKFIGENYASAESAMSPKAIRGLVLFVSSAVFGLFLVLLGYYLGLFSSETGWFAITILGLAWVIVVALMWRYPKGGSAKRRL